MQSQDVSGEFILKLWPWLEANRNRLIGLVVAVIGVSGVMYFISTQREQKELEAGQTLTALTVKSPPDTTGGAAAPELEQIATKYAGTPAGERASLEAAAALFAGGNYAEAQAQFQHFLDANGSGQFAPAAQLGVAASLEAQNKLDDAATAYQRVASLYPNSNSVQPAEFALGRIAEQQGRLKEALTHYEAAHGNPGAQPTSMQQEAMMREAEISAKLQAAAPKAPASAAIPMAGTNAAPSFLSLPDAKR
jgi:predicted negative regulator of RcsB-dependent stress response